MSYFQDLVPLADFPHVNAGLHAASEATMIATLGQPKMPLTTNDQPDRASAIVKAHLVTANVGPFRCTGFDRAVASLKAVLDSVATTHPDLHAVLGYGGMIAVRLRRPAHGAPSKRISNHAWGTAIDFLIDGKLFKETGGKVPRGIGLLIAPFNQAGWFAGCAFQDAMHFEVAEETIAMWHAEPHLLSMEEADAEPFPDWMERVADTADIVPALSDECDH